MFSKLGSEASGKRFRTAGVLFMEMSACVCGRFLSAAIDWLLRRKPIYKSITGSRKTNEVRTWRFWRLSMLKDGLEWINKVTWFTETGEGRLEFFFRLSNWRRRRRRKKKKIVRKASAMKSNSSSSSCSFSRWGHQPPPLSLSVSSPSSPPSSPPPYK